MCCTASPRKPHPSPALRKFLTLTLRLGFILGFHLFPPNIMASTNAYRVGRSVRRTLTCDMCKTRHQKCNGAQPQCSNCELRAITCSYSNQRAQGSDYALRPPELALRPSSVPRRFCPAEFWLILCIAEIPALKHAYPRPSMTDCTPRFTRTL
jgi:hypothetical protein